MPFDQTPRGKRALEIVIAPVGFSECNTSLLRKKKKKNRAAKALVLKLIPTYVEFFTKEVSDD